MPLSEEELRLLEQMERALVAEDPKLASTLRGTKMRQQAKRQLILGIIAFIIGVAALMAGAVLSLIPLGVAGFVIMLGSAYLSLTSWKGHTRNLAGTTPPTGETTGLRVVQGGGRGATRNRGSKPAKSGSMMERFEERWRRRREQGGM